MRQDKLGVRAQSRGASAELIVCADLLEGGFEVCRNVSPAGLVDLVARTGKKIWTIQVKRSGAISGEWEIFASVDNDNLVTYFDFNGAGNFPHPRLSVRCNMILTGELCYHKRPETNGFCQRMSVPGEPRCKLHLGHISVNGVERGKEKTHR